MSSNEEIARLGASSWHALYTRHHHEKVIAQALTGKGFEVFLPQYRAVHRWKDRQKDLQLPLFPNYVFIRGGLDRMLNILTTPGVHSIVSWGSRPAEVPVQEIEALRRLVESPLQVEPHPFLKCGDLVRVKFGPLEGIEGILVRKTRGVRLVLSVEMLAKSASVEVDVNMVERVRTVETNHKEKPRAVPGTCFAVSGRSYVLVAG
jgi:transcription antitermination factor NusG